VIRRRYIDLARGVAVLVMILAHVLDAWTAPAARASPAYRNLIVVGGLAAPLFLFLAGVGVLASVTRASLARGWPSAARAVIVRGLTIFALAFLFRLQAFVVSPGGPWIGLLRVDILNVIGLSMVAAGALLLVLQSRGRAALGCAVAASVISLITPAVREAGWVDTLPQVVQWYLRPAGEHTTFTLLPWAGFLFAGAAWAGLLRVEAGDANDDRALLVTAGAAVAVLVLMFVAATRPSPFPHSFFWTSSPAFFGIRVGLLLAFMAAMYWATRAAPRAALWPPLERLGRASFFVYWIHVELVYGYASWILHELLSLGQVLVGWVLFSGLMLGAVAIRDRLTNKRRRPRIMVTGGDAATI
jgi:uncharacterized membrane protein